MFACPLHDKARRRRVAKEKGIFREGEVDLNIFWQKIKSNELDQTSTKKRKADTAQVNCT